MPLHSVDYDGGQIWVNKEATRNDERPHHLQNMTFPLDPRRTEVRTISESLWHDYPMTLTLWPEAHPQLWDKANQAPLPFYPEVHECNHVKIQSSHHE